MEKQQKIEELTSIGLKPEQAETYLLLLNKGSSTAGKLASLSSLTRPMVYKLLDELVNMALVEKIEEPGRVTTFQCAHPLKLRSLIDQKRSEVEQKNLALEGVLGQLVSDYTAMSNRPGVRILQGLSGIDELYEDILNEAQPICLIRSPKDDHFPDLYSKVLKQIITPFVDETLDELNETDPANLVTRRLTNMDTFNIPAQIIIYADKVAITAFDNELITTIIQNDAISSTFSITFDFLWNVLEKEDKEIRKGLSAGTLTPPREQTPLPSENPDQAEHS